MQPGQEPILFSLFVIFAGAAVVATAALFARQALPVAYIVLGLIIGPHGLGLVHDPATVRDMADVGIIFLLFLLGLDLAPKGLLHMLRKATLVTMATSLLFAAAGYGVARAFGFSGSDPWLIGAGMMFSSTIIGLKLLPTTALHHQRMGEIIISILLLQDLIAIAILLLLEGMSGTQSPSGLMVAARILGLPALLLVAFLAARYVLIPLIRKFDKIREYIFLVAIGWCLGMAEFAALMGLSHEIGAFIGGVAVATSPIALYIADSLKPLRDFFLILFFFSLGAGFDLGALDAVLIPGLVLGMLMIVVKPVAFWGLLRGIGEEGPRSLEIGFRLGQISEFSLLIAVLALEAGALSNQGSMLVQTATLVTFVASTYLVVLRYPTPVAVSDRLRRD
jgi:Kef-type K+ transport system membrane component KefB